MTQHQFQIVPLLAAAVLAVAAAGCCRNGEPPRELTVDEAWDQLMAAIASQSVPEAEGDDFDAAADDSPVSSGRMPTAEDARTNIAARLTIALRANAVERADLAKRRAAVLEAAKEDNPEIAAALVAVVAARKRYDSLVAELDEIKAIDEELARLRGVRTSLVSQRERFESDAIAIPRPNTRKESK